MAEPEWTFWIHLVKDGAREGLLIGRRHRPAGQAEHAYFFMRSPQGLACNEQVVRLCGQEWVCEIHGLHKDENRVFELLKECAAFAGAQPTPPTQIPLRDVFHNRQESPEKVLPRLFETAGTGTLRNPDSQLRKFLVDWATFRSSILDLQSTSGTPVLSVRLRELSILAPNEVMPEDDLEYLLHARTVLATAPSADTASSRAVSPSPEWFRKQGPLAVDLKAGMVHIRTTRLHELRHLIATTPFSVLSGAPGTGKTVLIRTLALDLYESGWARVYLFDDRPFDIDVLARTINGIRGVVIIDNIHRQIVAYQRLFERLRSDPHRHVLFATRVPLKDIQDARHAPLHSLPHVSLAPFEDVNDIIRLFTAQDNLPGWSDDLSALLKSNTQHSLWLLAYALKGGQACNWQGSPKEWIADEVKHDLAELARCGDPYAGEYPEILVALSPLYMTDVSTVESFLTKRLGFHSAAITGLVTRGEVVCEAELPDGNVLYKLPHSGLAAAYWEHGKRYRVARGMLEYGDFIYDYAMAGPPNAWMAIAGALPVKGKPFLAWLPDDKRASLLEIQCPMMDVSYIIGTTPWHIIEGHIPTIVSAMERSDEPKWVLEALHIIAARHKDNVFNIWDRLDKTKVARLCCEHGCALDLSVFWESMVIWCAGRIWRELCGAFEAQALARCMLRGPTLRALAMAMAAMEECVPSVWVNVWRHIDAQAVATMVDAEERVYAIGYVVASIWKCDEHLGGEVWKRVDKVRMAQKLVESYESQGMRGNGVAVGYGALVPHSDIRSVGACIAEIVHARASAGEELWSHIERQKLAEKLCMEGATTESIECVCCIYAVEPKYGSELLNVVNDEIRRGVRERLGADKRL